MNFPSGFVRGIDEEVVKLAIHLMRYAEFVRINILERVSYMFSVRGIAN